MEILADSLAKGVEAFKPLAQTSAETMLRVEKELQEEPRNTQTDAQKLINKVLGDSTEREVAPEHGHA